MRIAVDPIACDAHGLCAELLPELITLDEWGYPLIADREISPALESLARRAVSRCPTLALRLANLEQPDPSSGAEPDASSRRSALRSTS